MYKKKKERKNISRMNFFVSVNILKGILLKNSTEYYIIDCNEEYGWMRLSIIYFSLV